MKMRPDLPLIERVAAMLRDMLGEGYDDDTFLDTLDGETDAVEIADRLIASMQGDEALAAAAKEQADALAARSKRLGDRARAKKRTLLAVMDAMGVRKLERPAATLSRRAGGVSLVITDEAAIPSQLTRTRVEPDKAAIKKQLQAGEDVPGAALAQGDDTISVRVK
jgi:hypothetical protein